MKADEQIKKPKAKKGQVSVRLDSGSIKACFPRNYFDESKQLKIATGISAGTGWEAIANRLQRRLQIDLEDGKLNSDDGSFNKERYNEILEEYGLRARLRLVKSIAIFPGLEPGNADLVEVWNTYLEYIKPRFRETYFNKSIAGTYTNFVLDAIKATESEDAIRIRNWLIENRSKEVCRNVLSHLSKAYQFAIRCKTLTHNPFDGLSDEISNKQSKGRTYAELEEGSDDDVIDRSKAYSWGERQIILDYISTSRYSHYLEYFTFKFLTGCRTGESIALTWNDVLWDKQQILIRKTYSLREKKFYPLKNDSSYKGSLIRIFPMPEDGELWNLLKSIPQRDPSDVVFRSIKGNIVNADYVSRIWKNDNVVGANGIILDLIEQGKLKKYLPPYNTRHTFISHQIFDLGRDEKIVSAWCGHSEAVSQKHYQDIADRARQINPDVSAHQNEQLCETKSEIELLREQMKQQQELINRLIQEKGE